jgi:hypothetical protein
MTRPLPPLWPCPACGRAFANRNQTHRLAEAYSVGAQEHLR